MQKLLLAAVILVCSCALASAQSPGQPRAEIFAGYSVLRTSYEPELPRGSLMPIVLAFKGDQTLTGFNASVGWYLTDRFGMTADVSGHVTTDTLAGPLGDIATRIRVLTALAGPQYKFRNRSRVAPFVRALAGIAHTSARLRAGGASGTNSSTDFAVALGGGIDVRVGEFIDLRLIQADYTPIFLSRGNNLGFGRARADNVRFSSGVTVVWK